MSDKKRMSPEDEMVRVRIAYGDKEYSISIDRNAFMHVRFLDSIEHMFIANVYKALSEFHGENSRVWGQVARQKQALHELCYKRPDIAEELDIRGLL